MGLAAEACGISLDQGLNCTLCVVRWILIHCATREVLFFFFFSLVAAGDGGIKYILVIIEPGSPCGKVFTAEVIAEENVSCSVCRFQGVTGSCQEGTPGCSGLGRALWGSMGIQLCSSSPATWYLLIHVLGSEQG